VAGQGVCESLKMNIHPLVIEDIVRRALLEDLGHGCDVTSNAVIPDGKTGEAVIKAREGGVLAGLDVAVTAFKLTDPDIRITKHKNDGEVLQANDEILTVTGSARSLLTGERTALNFLSHLSGIATETAKYVEAVKSTKATIICTRKTLPGLRALQKYAVRAGGGSNHRFGLDDAVLIKDNHIALAGGIENAIKRVQENAGHMLKIEVEVDTLEQLKTALSYKIDAVLLDNMDKDMLKEAVALVNGTVLTEASGGINIGTVRDIAQSGVDMISVGTLTHSVKALDIGLDMI